ncbi:uncharacterized protein K460DRAFT_348164 [Cucurbitaria berberidis CBS 394.84]|uniref:Uncharacterized protein n=1 Tax=Cucurbitaria berberidis CBS 394.84 TaxID=1168544 RepID=A0A9P4L3T2_9PLEO|nr:uncharacterized protein K460DRAFT_348164 [Cucurbitaria berberidis CBS 394.84]KAF1841281.1 hypothetical protein K460DRAFT_348164 [Cucurbitaria berberidis CBS 394.84]
MNQNLYHGGNVLIWPFDLARLLSEKEILENGLANCVTYLHALRKKQARNERRLIKNPSLPKKKRKKIQQSKRELEREIKHREQDELAFLNNLQACKANIYIAETLNNSSTTLSSAVLEQNSSSTYHSVAEGSEPTEPSWNGWTDDAAISPFQMRSNNPFFAAEIAPEDNPEDINIEPIVDKAIKRPPPLVRYTEDDGAALPVPPNTAQPQYLYSTLCPEAAAFEPCLAFAGHTNPFPEQYLDKLSISPSSTINGMEHLQRRRVTDAGLSQIIRQLSLQPRPHLADSRCHTWCNTTPHQSPNKDTRSGVLERGRTNSL